jgi:hypothetical protein
MDILEILQTIGICVGSLALVAITVMMFLIVSSFVLPAKDEVTLVDMQDFMDEVTSEASPKRSRRTPKSKK